MTETGRSAKRLAELRRYRDLAHDRAAIIAAITTCRIEARDTLAGLTARHDAQLADLLHEFAYFARKATEIACRSGFDIGEGLERKGITCFDRSEGRSMYNVSINFVLGRIIHSDSFEVERVGVPPDAENRTHYLDRPWAFSVGSDKDKGGTHFVWTEFFLEAYLTVDQQMAFLLDLYEEGMRRSELEGGATR